MNILVGGGGVCRHYCGRGIILEKETGDWRRGNSMQRNSGHGGMEEEILNEFKMCHIEQFNI